ncbi:Uncharacterized membrane protein [Mariniphaga anaerophila]|uniref:Uncharacterized membrane protein n=1 Tax=Mariniphaga anaerophila TaxID=1484053 RepID=A0A1M4WS07_9BACT|nr:DUF819 family protein [Mariniphaga anaerophila]SHE83947.1 Uncharacterized membrane protein [Mariniphaga anaerophila]
MWITATLILFYLLTPVLLIYLCKISDTLKRIGAVVLAYAIGLVLGNIGILPTPSEGLVKLLGGTRSYIPKEELLAVINAPGFSDSDLTYNMIAQVQESIMNYTILIALPLLLFSLNLRKWMKNAHSTIISLVLAMVSLMISVFIGYYLFAHNITESNKVTGMLIGVYTGGTPNLAAIGTALNVSPNTFILTHTYDLIIGSVALLFLMTIAQRLFNTFLPKYNFIKKAENVMQVEIEEEDTNMENYDGLFSRKNLPEVAKSLLVSIVIFAIGGGISFLVPKQSQVTWVILTITTLGLLASLIRPINKLKISFPLGMYFIIVFCLALSSMANLKNMFQIEFLELFLFVLWVVVGSMIIHVALARIFKVDTDTTIIAITALTYSPPFVPAVAMALKNKEVIIGGLTIGILGFAFGSYLGIFIGSIL